MFNIQIPIGIVNGWVHTEQVIGYGGGRSLLRIIVIVKLLLGVKTADGIV